MVLNNDAFALMVEFRIPVTFHVRNGIGYVHAGGYWCDEMKCYSHFSVAIGDDPEAAVRRAIALCAQHKLKELENA